MGFPSPAVEELVMAVSFLLVVIALRILSIAKNTAVVSGIPTATATATLPLLLLHQ